MTERSDDLQLFVNCAFVAFDRFVRGPEFRRCILEICAGSRSPGCRASGLEANFPFASTWDTSLAVEPADGSLRGLMESFKGIEPQREWRPRMTCDAKRVITRVDAHANAMIIARVDWSNATTFG